MRLASRPAGWFRHWRERMDSFRTYGPLAALITLLLVVTPANAAIVATYTSAEALVNSSEAPALITFEEITNAGPYNNYNELSVSTTYGSVALRGWSTTSNRADLSVPQNPNPSWTGNYLNQDGIEPFVRAPHLDGPTARGLFRRHESDANQLWKCRIRRCADPGDGRERQRLHSGRAHLAVQRVRPMATRMPRSWVSASTYPLPAGMSINTPGPGVVSRLTISTWARTH